MVAAIQRSHCLQEAAAAEEGSRSEMAMIAAVGVHAVLSAALVGFVVVVHYTAVNHQYVVVVVVDDVGCGVG